MKISIDSRYSEGHDRETGYNVPAHVIVGAGVLAGAIVAELLKNNVAEYVEVVRFRPTHHASDCVVCKVDGEINVFGAKKVLSHVLTITIPDLPKEYGAKMLQEDLGRFMIGIRHDLSRISEESRKILANLDSVVTPSAA